MTYSIKIYHYYILSLIVTTYKPMITRVLFDRNHIYNRKPEECTLS